MEASIRWPMSIIRSLNAHWARKENKSFSKWINYSTNTNRDLMKRYLLFNTRLELLAGGNGQLTMSSRVSDVHCSNESNLLLIYTGVKTLRNYSYEWARKLTGNLILWPPGLSSVMTTQVT